MTTPRHTGSSRSRRMPVPQRLRSSVVRRVYHVRGGWRAKAGAGLTGLIARLTDAPIVTAAHLHFLYILNRRDALSHEAWKAISNPSRLQSNQTALHMLLKTAWLLRDDALLDDVLKLLNPQALSAENLSFVCMRKTAHPALATFTAEIADQAVSTLCDLDTSVPLDHQTVARLAATLDVTESFDLPKDALDRLRAIEGDPAIDRYLGRLAMHHEDWPTAFERLEKACAANPANVGNYLALGDVALQFNDPLARVSRILDQRDRAGAIPNGYDRLLGYKHLLDSNYLAFLELRDTQVSNAVARQVYGGRARLGPHAGPFPNSGNTAFVIGRDGVSDELRWSAYYADLAARFDSVAISCDPRLEKLFRRSFPEVTFYPVARTWGRSQTSGPDISRDRVPNLELASRLDNVAYGASQKADEVMFIEDVALRAWRTRGLSGPPDTGEPMSAPLQPDPDRADAWKSVVNPGKGGHLNVGLIWRSGLLDADRQRHYMQLPDFRRLTDLPITLYSIQHQVTEDERREGGAMGLHFVDDQIDFYNDFDEIAAFTSQLDVVVGISTLPYELAAAVGTECWLCAISPLGRWMRLGAEGTLHDRLTRNGLVFYPRNADAYLAPRTTRVDSIVQQIEQALAQRCAQ